MSHIAVIRGFIRIYENSVFDESSNRKNMPSRNHIWRCKVEMEYLLAIIEEDRTQQKKEYVEFNISIRDYKKFGWLTLKEKKYEETKSLTANRQYQLFLHFLLLGNSNKEVHDYGKNLVIIKSGGSNIGWECSIIQEKDNIDEWLCRAVQLSFF